MPADGYLDVNRSDWDSRATVHAQGYGIDRLLADPEHLSSVVEFDRPRLGDIDGPTSSTCSATSAPTR